MIQVLIAEDSPHIRESLCTLIDGQPDLIVVDMACDGLEATEMTLRLLPHVVLMDAQMPCLDGVEATKQIKQILPDVGILFFSVYTDYVEASIAAGSDGYLTKDCDSEELFTEIRRIASNYGGSS